jgi:hypothetical protein
MNLLRRVLQIIVTSSYFILCANMCNSPPNLPNFSYNVFKLAMSADPSQGIYRRIEIRSAHSVTLYWLKSCNWLTPSACSFSSIYICVCLSPFVKTTSHCKKNPVKTIPWTMNTCTQLITAISKRIQTIYGKEASQHSTHISWQVHMCITCKPK